MSGAASGSFTWVERIPVLRRRSGAGRLGAFSGDEFVVGENDFSTDQLWGVDGLKALDGFGLAVASLGGSILENEKVQESRGVIFLLPCQVHARAGLAGLDIANEFLN